MTAKNDGRKKFLIDMALVNSVQAAFGHARIYVEHAKGTESVREEMRKKLRALGANYSKRVGEQKHCANIEGLADAMTKSFSQCGILYENKFRIGTAQKALNLYLKYLWCLGKIEEPLHCPLDRRIIGQVKKHLPDGLKDAKWTKLDSIDDYQTIMEKCREKAKADGFKSIAEWELETWPKA